MSAEARTSNPGLSPVMQQLVAEMRQHGHVVRHPGGFWCCGSYSISGSYGTSTVEALVRRRVAEYAEWQDRRSGGRFPIKARLLVFNDER